VILRRATLDDAAAERRSAAHAFYEAGGYRHTSRRFSKDLTP
jgi:hypothetical protein